MYLPNRKLVLYKQMYIKLENVIANYQTSTWQFGNTHKVLGKILRYLIKIDNNM